MSYGQVVSRASLQPFKKSASGKYAAIFAVLMDLKPSDAYKVTVADAKAGYTAARELRRIAVKEHLRLGWERSQDGKTFYFWLERVQP